MKRTLEIVRDAMEGRGGGVEFMGDMKGVKEHFDRKNIGRSQAAQSKAREENKGRYSRILRKLQEEKEAGGEEGGEKEVGGAEEGVPEQPDAGGSATATSPVQETAVTSTLPPSPSYPTPSDPGTLSTAAEGQAEPPRPAAPGIATSNPTGGACSNNLSKASPLRPRSVIPGVDTMVGGGGSESDDDDDGVFDTYLSLLVDGDGEEEEEEWEGGGKRRKT